MGRSAAWSEDEVIEAGKSLVAAGKRVTGWELRKVLGAGRPDRLEAIWTAFTAQNAAKPEPPPDAELPPSVTALESEIQESVRSMVHDMCVRVWRSTHGTMLQRLASEMSAIAAERATHKEYCLGAECSAEESDRTRTDLESRIAGLIGRLDVANGTIAALEERVSSTEKAKSDLTTLVESLKSDLATAEAIGTAARQAVAVADTRTAAAEAARGQAVADVETARREVGEAMASAARELVRAENALALNATIRAELAETARQLASAREAVADATARASARDAEISRVRHERLAAEDGRRAAESALAAARTQFEVASARQDSPKHGRA